MGDIYQIDVACCFWLSGWQGKVNSWTKRIDLSEYDCDDDDDAGVGDRDDKEKEK